MERGPASQHLVEDRPERVDVRGRSNQTGLSPGLLRRHVSRRAHDHSAPGVFRRDIEPLGQPEIGDLGNSIDRQEHVCRLQVPVKNTSLVDVTHGLCQYLGHLRRLVRGHGPLGEGLGEAAPLDELERQVREVVLLTDLVDRDDVGMLHAGDGLGFGAKA